MGGASSVLTQTDADALEHITGPHILPKNHPAWHAITNLNRDLTSDLAVDVNRQLAKYCVPFGTIHLGMILKTDFCSCKQSAYTQL